MEVDTTFYVLLDNTLDTMAKQEEIILNRNSTDRKMQTVAVNSFISWNDRFEDISHEFLHNAGSKVNLTDKQLSGEKNLARLRFFGRFWKENERKVENINFKSVRELQNEKKRIENAVKRLQSFKQELGGSKLAVDSIDNKLTQKDEIAFERLLNAIDKLQAKSKVIDEKLAEMSSR